MAQYSRIEAGPQLFIVVGDYADLKEQDVNAQVMAPRDFERLTENIRTRGALESLPYCAQPGGLGDIQIVSGHHRIRAALQAGIKQGPYLLDVSPLTRSQIVAKQIAHNQLVGMSDEGVLKQLLQELESADDWLETGLPEEWMPNVSNQSPPILMPHADFDWRTVSFVFLPHQLDDFKLLLDTLDGKQEVVAVADRGIYESFTRACAQFQRIKDIRSAGTAIALLTAIALREAQAAIVAGQEADSDHQPDEPVP